MEHICCQRRVLSEKGGRVESLIMRSVMVLRGNEKIIRAVSIQPQGTQNSDTSTRQSPDNKADLANASTLLLKALVA